jgi:putative ATP-dependent endonuclease of OLD family
MLIKALHIQKFRCFQDQHIEIEPLTAILGRNGSGKSTVLTALEIFYDVSSPISIDDFYNRDVSQDIEIQVIYTDLRDGPEQAEFTPYIKDGLLGVKKVIRWNNGRPEQKYYASELQIPEFAEIRAMKKKTDQVNEWNRLCETGAIADGQQLPLRGADVEAAILEYEATHPEQLKWVDKEEQFFGPRNIGGGKLDKYTKFVRVPAVRDVMDDLADKRGSPLFQLLDMLVMRRVNARDDVRRLKAEFSERIQEVYNSANLTELSELADGISNTLQVFVPNSRLNLQWMDAKLPEIPNPSYSSELEEDEFCGAIDRKGHGLQRALIFSLLQHLAVAKPVEIPDDDKEERQGLQTEDASSPRIEPVELSPDLILAIDEPELYQHPQRSRHLASVLRSMTRNPALGLGASNQVIYSTHSPYFVELGSFDQLRIIRKQKCLEGAPHSSVTQYTLAEASHEMARATGRDPGAFTAETFYVRAYPVMTLAVNEGFFADAVVLVEGLTEVAVLTTVAEIMSEPWLEKGITIIPADGKSKLDRIFVIFRGLGIPTYLVFDGDNRHKGTDKEKKEVVANRILLSLVGVSPEDFPIDGVFENHACFGDEFETYVKNAIGESEFYEMRDEVAAEFGYDRPGEILKNFDACSEFTRRAYQNGYRLLFIEDIIHQVVDLVQI